MPILTIMEKPQEQRDRFAGVLEVKHPKILQTLCSVPPLFPFTRTTVYLLLGPKTIDKIPSSVTLRATSPMGPLSLKIPVMSRPEPSGTIHQLAARKIIQELEEGRGWIHQARTKDHRLVKDRYPSMFQDMVEREAARLGVQYQIGGKWCSFVAVEGSMEEYQIQKEKATDQLTGRSGKPDYDPALPVQWRALSKSPDNRYDAVGSIGPNLLVRQSGMFNFPEKQVRLFSFAEPGKASVLSSTRDKPTLDIGPAEFSFGGVRPDISMHHAPTTRGCVRTGGRWMTAHRTSAGFGNCQQSMRGGRVSPHSGTEYFSNSAAAPASSARSVALPLFMGHGTNSSTIEAYGNSHMDSYVSKPIPDLDDPAPSPSIPSARDLRMSATVMSRRRRQPENYVKQKMLRNARLASEGLADPQTPT